MASTIASPGRIVRRLIERDPVTAYYDAQRAAARARFGGEGRALKRAKGHDTPRYARDKEAFKDQFSQYMDQQVAQDREGYMQRLLRDAVNNRHMLPVFVIDNTDEYGISYKEKIFQYFQSASRAAKKCLMIFPATDK